MCDKPNDKSNKIAIVTCGFEGSTLSLALAFLRIGYKVDLYHVDYCSDRRLSKETLELSFRGRVFSVSELQSNGVVGIKRFDAYASKGRFSFYQVETLGYSNKTVKFFITFLTNLFIRRLSQRLLSNNYLFVNVIGQTEWASAFSCVLKNKGCNVFHSLHEICNNHLAEETSLAKPIEKLVQYQVPINVFSRKSFDDLLRLSSISSSKVSMIPFHLFDGYKEFKGKIIQELKGQRDFVLFFGYIQPYKGLDVLYKSVELLQNSDIKIVVAGGGSDVVLESMKTDDRYIVINRWITNSELVELIESCRFVVCPYKSSSQTGITQTVFNFDKPIVASLVPAFETTIDNDKTGILVQVGASDQLASAIDVLYRDEEMYVRMCANVRDIRLSSDKKWEKIASMYVEHYL
ncbi:MAG: glycosyltransferase [Bacteroidales bacterium]|nr:glycosyltransferase [Bacteroidales bacterium]